ncbi:winged helix-turn-helix domain-containing protein [Plantactinospora sp. CA-290183]|uniref:winged helix-turn-helix domain-containing protein n=1 Tax=Plantactinospora sp. CA-290183 TaxID=3240006 RepID=UPI003D90985A
MIYPNRAPVGYQDLADILRARVSSGEIPPGRRLPSEGTLAQTYGVATRTARAALQQLRNEGLAELARGYGVVVREHVDPELITVEPGSTVSARNPTPQERREYEVPEGVPLLVVTGSDGLSDLYPAHRYRVVFARP